MIQHIKLRWLSLYSSIDRLLLVYEPVKDYFTDESNKKIPGELKEIFESEETLCVLMFLHHILFEIQKTNLELQRECVTAVDLHRIISTLRYKLKQRMDNSFFGIHCRQLLNRLSPEVANTLKSSFVRFIAKFLEYVDRYFSHNAALFEKIGRFGNGIENLTWNDIQECIEVTKIKGLDENNLFNEFTEVKLTFEIIKRKDISIADQIRCFLSNRATSETPDLSRTIIEESTNGEAEDEQETVFQSDHLWAMLFAVQSVPTPNMKKLISYIYSIPASNAYVESVFSEMKHLFNDFRNRMSSDTIAAELQIRRNSRLSCTDMYSHLLSQKELLTAISANRKYTVKK